MSYVSKQELQRELPFDSDDFRMEPSVWDSLLTTILSRESDRVLGWVSTEGNETAFREKSAERAMSGSGGKELPLPKRPVKSVESLTVDGTTVDPSDVYVEEAFIRLKPDAPVDEFPDSYRSVNVQWTYGYSSVPEPVKAGVIRLARNGLDQIETDGVKQEAAGGDNMSYKPPDEIKREVYEQVIEYQPESYYSGVSAI